MTKQELIDRLTRRPEAFTPKAGPDVLLIPMGVAERYELQAWRNGIDGQPTPEQVAEMNARLYIGSVCDEAGSLIFTLDDLPVVLRFDPVHLESVAGEALRRNGLLGTDAGKGSPPT